MLLHTLDLLGTIVFAASGALLAYEHRQRLAMAGLYAFLTALGGGTIRDLILQRSPVFWIQCPEYLGLAITTGLLIFKFVHVFPFRREHLYHLDAISMATFTIIGAQTILESPNFMDISLFHWFMMHVMGLLTAAGGGIVRDLISRHTSIPYVMKDPGYLVASLLGTLVYAILMHSPIPPLLSVSISILIMVGFRMVPSFRVMPSGRFGAT